MIEETHRERRPRRRVLTDKMVPELPRKARPYFHPDPEMAKHGVRVQPNGPPHGYYVVARDPFGKQVWKKTGDTGAALCIAEAREIARQVIRRIEQGRPAFEPPAPKSDSVATVLAEWLKRHVDKNGLRTAPELRRVVRAYILPHWGDRPFVGILRSEIAKLLDYVEDNNGAHQADAVLSVLRMAGGWYRNREDDYVSPFTGIKRRVAKPNRKRSRTLNDAEIRAVWLAADKAGPFGGLVLLLLLTAQRLEKVRTLRWSDVSPDGVWTIATAPREKGNAGSLKLPDRALKIIEAQPRLVSNHFVFAGNNGGAKAFDHRAKIAFDQLCGVTSWRLHDLRRTARSLMSRAGVLNDHAELVLGHARPGVEGTYDLHKYHNEKASALAELAALIEHIVNSGNVVPTHEAVS
jgi:integrase